MSQAKLQSVCCKGTLKPLYKRCRTSAKAEIHVQTSGSKDLMPMSIKLRYVHTGCPGTSLAASPLHPDLVRGVLGKSPQSAKRVPHVQGGPLQPPKQSDTLACAPQAMHSTCTLPKGLSQGWGRMQSQKSVQT